jgi:hypothetical protein
VKTYPYLCFKSNLKHLIMKALFLIIGLLVCANSFANNNHDVPTPKGFNYKKHYRKAKRTHFFNRALNSNNCKGKSHHSS